MGARCWNDEDDRKLFEGRRNGERFEDIAAKIGRSPKACRARFDKAAHGRDTYNELQAVKEIREASEQLGNAINDLIDRMPANDVAEMLGKPHLSLFAPYGTASAMRRLAA